MRDDRFYRYIGVNFTFGLLDCDRYIGDIFIQWIVKSGFCSIHFTVTLAGLKKVNCYIENTVYISNIVISGFHCISRGPGGGGGTPYNGLYGKASPERGALFRLEIYERVGISRAEV